MVEIDVYWFYWMSMVAYRLHTIQDDIPLSIVAGDLGLARVALETIGDERARAFPNTAAKVQEILACINEIMPERSPGEMVRDKPISSYHATVLRNGMNALTSTLKDEAQKSYVLCVENQRFLSAYNLVERIESCFSEDAWKLLDEAAKKEFEEAGKCLAFERYTGAGFHALRAVECVIRQYILAVSGSLPKKRDWGHYIDVLKQNGAEPKLVAVLDNIRTLDRNPLMHPEDWLDVDEAIGIFTTCNTAIVRLMADLKTKGKI